MQVLGIGAALRMNLSGRTAFPYVLLLDDKLSVQRIPLKHGDLIRVGRALLQTSARNTPPLFGLGLVDKMPPSTLNRVMSGQRKRTPGIAGQVAGKFGCAAKPPAYGNSCWALVPTSWD